MGIVLLSHKNASLSHVNQPLSLTIADKKTGSSIPDFRTALCHYMIQSPVDYGPKRLSYVLMAIGPI